MGKKTDEKRLKKLQEREEQNKAILEVQGLVKEAQQVGRWEARMTPLLLFWANGRRRHCYLLFFTSTLFLEKLCYVLVCLPGPVMHPIAYFLTSPVDELHVVRRRLPSFLTPSSPSSPSHSYPLCPTHPLT
jgi:hypothetical protein